MSQCDPSPRTTSNSPSLSLFSSSEEKVPHFCWCDMAAYFQTYRILYFLSFLGCNILINCRIILQGTGMNSCVTCMSVLPQIITYHLYHVSLNWVVVILGLVTIPILSDSLITTLMSHIIMTENNGTSHMVHTTYCYIGQCSSTRLV